MVRKNHYPRASFLRAMELAKAIDSLGGKCTREMCATKINRQHTSGSFTTLVATAVKHRLIATKPNQTLEVSDLYKQIKFSYSDTEKRENEIRAFLAPSMYKAVYNRFLNRELPSDILQKLFIREFDVEPGSASKVAGYFLEGVKYLGLLEDGQLIGNTAVTTGLPLDFEESNNENDEDVSIEEEKLEITAIPQDRKVLAELDHENSKLKSSVDSEIENIKVRNNHLDKKTYLVYINGPGVDLKLDVSNTHEFAILETMLSLLKINLEKNEKEAIL